MPRRFALLLLALLLLLLVAFLAGRRLTGGFGRGRTSASVVPTPRPTAPIPPTPIPPRRVALWFEGEEDGLLHPEARDLPAASDAVALLRAVASAIFEGPRRSGLLRPFPEGWRLRAAYRMKDGLAVLDLAPPAPAADGTSSTTSAAPTAQRPPQPLQAQAPQPRWEPGAHEEWTALQSLVFSAARNLPELKRFVILVSGEPAETLGGHVDLSHPIVPDGRLASEEAPGEPPAPTPTPEPSPTAAPSGPAAPRPPAVPPGPKPKPTPRRTAAPARPEATV